MPPIMDESPRKLPWWGTSFPVELGNPYQAPQAAPEQQVRKFSSASFVARVFGLWLATNVIFAIKMWADGSLPIVLQHPLLPWLLPTLELLITALAVILVRDATARGIKPPDASLK